MLLFVTADDLKQDLGLITLKIVKGGMLETKKETLKQGLLGVGTIGFEPMTSSM